MPAILPLPLSSPQKRSLAILLGLMVLSALTEGFGLVLLVPMLAALDDGQGASLPLVETLGDFGIPLSLGGLLLLFVALVLLRAAINYARTVRAFRFEMLLVDGLRARAWDALLHCEWRQLSAMRQTDNASLLISNIDRVGYGVAELLRAVATIVTLGGVGLAALAISPSIALAAGLSGLAVLVAYRGLQRRAARQGDALSEAYRLIHARTAEGLGALRLTKSFGREDQASRESREAFLSLRRAQFAYLRDQGLAQAALQCSGAILLAALVWVAISFWDAGLARILPLAALFARALPLLGVLQRGWQNWSHARPALSDVMRLIDVAESGREAADTAGVEAPRLSRELVLDAVTVQFEGRDRPALDSVSMSFPAGSITAIEGPSGAGKSTLADLVGGLLGPDAGAMLIDGAVLDGQSRRAWRSRVTYVQQEPVLFTGTVRENLLWADPTAREEALDTALSSASARFVHDLPEGLDTRIGEGGRQLSGGERQRLVLARALLHEPSLLILDEVSSALDSENEAAIARAIDGLRGRMTIVIIGHRGVLGRLADRTVSLRNGRVTAAN